MADASATPRRPPIRVLLADDHAILRDGLAMLVNGQGDMRVVAEAASGREALAQVEAVRPDVAVLDISMPDGGGAEIASEICRRCPEVHVLALTRHADPAYVRRLIDAGATGYVLKKSAADTLIGAIRALAAGGTYIEPALAGSVARAGAAVRHGGEPGLTAREEQVIRQVAWGRSSKEVAAELGLSTKTVESYKASALQKLNLRTRSDIVRYALARGWLAEDAAPE